MSAHHKTRRSGAGAISAQSSIGRLLLALRAGPLEPEALYARLGKHSAIAESLRCGFVRRLDAYQGGAYTLTEAGRAACPCRNPLAATASSAPAGAAGGRGLPPSRLQPTLTPMRLPGHPPHPPTP